MKLGSFLPNTLSGSEEADKEHLNYSSKKKMLPSPRVNGAPSLGQVEALIPYYETVCETEASSSQWPDVRFVRSRGFRGP